MENPRSHYIRFTPWARQLLLAAPFLLLLLSVSAPLFGQAISSRPNVGRGSAAELDPFAPIGGALYETTFRKDNVEIFSRNGTLIGLVGKIGRPTGLAFDAAGNLFVVSDDSTAGYSIKKVSAIDGTISTFTTAALSGPHGLAFDQAGYLYVANNNNNTIARYTRTGVATIFADRGQGLVNPIGLAFDAEGNLFVTNTHGGPARSGRIIKLSPAGEAILIIGEGLMTPYGVAFDASGNLYVSVNGSNEVRHYAPDGTDLGVFCSSGLASPYGIVFDDADNLYVANNSNATIEKYAADGTDLGVFADTRSGPHFLAIYHPQ
ncbi:MAG TPA: NHL repeat-containing protein [Chthoniobacterales bacterium]|nr:NHL repeat-containing protein [Chthoniobacterales bacterium]